ncbi:MAG TPA: hypothetical protein VGC46_11225 [Allosphingosinicella sp.]
MLLLALALFVAAQGAAVEVEARCVVDGFTLAERDRIVTIVRQGTQPDAALQARLEGVGMDCAASRGWDEQRGGVFIAFALGSMVRDNTGPQLRRAGIDTAWLEAWLARQDERVQTTPAIELADSERMVRELHAQGTPLATLEAQSELIGAYVAGLAIMERARRGLAFD